MWSADAERNFDASRARANDAVWGIRFTDRKPLRSWMDLTTHDENLGWRWAIELMKRGLLVTPNEKFYISIAHTDADVDQTLSIVDEAFAAVKPQRTAL
jgi:glutamate-1-semialdehyde aminotransferase